MKSHLRKWLADVREAFRLLPVAMGPGGVLLAVGLPRLGESAALPAWLEGSA
ncbi:MAG TPA: hypothetical protein VFU95_08695 [Telluria sp.]|nr:hypothetical protein [Telluria sp.]